MKTKNANHKIKYALYLHEWAFEGGTWTVLESKGKNVLPGEYEQTMKGHIFCPTCKTNLNRVPHDKEHFSNNRDAHFRHLSKYNGIPCVLKSKKPEGKCYDTFEEAKKAIDEGNLVIVNQFLSDKPELPPRPTGEYDETAVENLEGPISEIPISRHMGASYLLPSKVMTMRGICREFKVNLSKYYVFPGMTYALRLDSLLHDIENITVIDGSPKLYFGIVLNSSVMGKGLDNNIRMTMIRCNEKVKDFTIKTYEGMSKERGLMDNSSERVILTYGRVTISGVGLCIENVNWGEFDLLPEKYKKCLIP